MRSRLILLTLGVPLIAGACATKSGTGTAVGAGGGALIGGALGGWQGAFIGGAIGGIAGYATGRAMEEDDRRRAEIAIEQNRSAYWRNSSNGNVYRVTPVQTQFRGGRECRDFRIDAEVNGRPDQVTGTACRRPDGSWEPLSG